MKKELMKNNSELTENRIFGHAFDRSAECSV